MKLGNVPTSRVGPVLERLIAERWPESLRNEDEAGGLEILAEKVGCDRDAIAHIISQQHEGCSFDLADRLLCALGPGVDIWRGELADVYLGTQLLETCKAPGCNTQFQVGVDTLGRPLHQRYCSPQCNRAAYRIRTGRKKRRLVAAHRDSNKRCRNGHLRTPENTKTNGRGQRTCRICWNASRRKEAA